MRVEDVGALLDRRLAPVSCCLTRSTSPIAPVARSIASRIADGVDAVGLAAGHQHAGAGQRVGDLERQRRAVLGVEAGDELVAAVLAQLVHLRRDALLVGHDEHREVGLALGARAVELLDRLRLRQPRGLGLEHDAAARRAGAALDRHHDVAGLAGAALDVADRVAVVALARRRSRRAPRTRPPRTSGPWRCRARPPARRPRPSPSPPAPRSSSSRRPWIVWFISLQARVVLVGGLLDHRQRRALVDGERVVVGVGGELLAQVVADLPVASASSGLDAGSAPPPRTRRRSASRAPARRARSPARTPRRTCGRRPRRPRGSGRRTRPGPRAPSSPAPP